MSIEVAMNSDGSENDRYVSRRNRLTLAAALIGAAVIALSWLGAHYRDRKRQEVTAPPTAVAKPNVAAPASLRIDGLPADSTISVDSKIISPDSFSTAPGHHLLAVRAAGFRDLEKPVDFAGGLNRYQIKMCPLTAKVKVSKPPKPLKTLDLANRFSAWQPCTDISCEETQADIDRRANQIVAKTCSNWDKAAHRRRGRSATEDGAGLVTEVACEASVKSPRCRLKIIRGTCEVSASPSMQVESEPFECPASGALDFSSVPASQP
jgi:hypothetical protein